MHPFFLSSKMEWLIVAGDNLFYLFRLAAIMVQLEQYGGEYGSL